MSVIIVSSEVDPASLNIKNCLLEKSTWMKLDSFYDYPVFKHSKMQDIMLLSIPDRKITHENLDKEIENELSIKPKQIIFVSRHRSKLEFPTLTVHPIGNYGTAEFGGKSKSVIKSSPRLMTHLLRLIKKNLQPTGLDYQVCYEVTHHGPYLETPTFFVEIGSTEKKWKDKTLGNIISQSILELLDNFHYEEDLSNEIPVLVGIGGGHYAPRFTHVIFEKKAAFGHMIPSYHIKAGNFDKEILEKAIKATPNFSAVYIDKKAIKKSQVTEYKQWLQDMKIPVISSTELPALE